MINKTKKRIGFLSSLSCMILLAFVSIFASPMQHLSASAMTYTNMQSANEVKVMATTNATAYTYVYAPTMSAYRDYNCAVRFVWECGEGGTGVVLSNSYDFYPSYYFPGDYSEITMANYWVGQGEARPTYFMAKSYDQYSGSYSSMVEVGEIYGSTILYGCLPKYAVVNQLNRALITDENVPTSFDKTGFIWSHNASTNKTIRGTISYNGTFANLEVKVPFLGTTSSSVSILGKTFKIRTGPNKVSICAGSSGVAAADINFAFGVS